jgi:rhodanese-related sulfurtransferase
MRTISGLPFALIFIVAKALAGPAPQAIPSSHDVDLAHGAGLYEAHCGRCHGSHGDDISCSGDMTPLAGLCKRPRTGLIVQLMSPEYFARGAHFEGDDARDLTAYLCSLKGEKGFDSPEFVCIPRLLHKEGGYLRYYRVIDVRDQAAYDKAHISNAVRWPIPLSLQPPLGSTEADVRSILGLFGVRPDTMIVIYDETVSTKAALLWWSLMRAGHKSAAILDGGVRRWTEEGYTLTPWLTPLTPLKYDASPMAAPRFPILEVKYPVLRLDRSLRNASPGTFTPELTLTEGRLRTAAEIRSYLEQCEIRLTRTYRVRGNAADAPFLVYLLHLLGCHEAQFDPANDLLQIAANP